MDVTALDGRAYAKFIAAGTYFLRKYRQVLNDLNVFPVPDGDTGTNMYLTARSAMLEAAKLHDAPLSDVAAAAAAGSLMGARGNSGVIISQMLRGFAHHVRHRSEIDTFVMATAMRESVAAAKGALLRPVEGTIISVAEAAGEAAYHLALRERDFYRLLAGVLRAANEALDRTTDQLAVLKEAGVVDSGGAGFVYFLEGILRFLPDVRVRATAFPRRPARSGVFTRAQVVGENKFCTEFLVEDATCSALDLRHVLEPRGESLLVIGAPPVIKVHIHTGAPERVREIAGKFGTVIRVKVDNMEQQHNLLLVDKPAGHSILAVVPGPGFERIVKELGAEVSVTGDPCPGARDLLLGINKCLGDEVYLFVNDASLEAAASEVAGSSDKRVHVIPTRDIIAGIAGLFAFRSGGEECAPSLQEIERAIERVRSAKVFLSDGQPAAKVGGTLLGAQTLGDAAREAARAMGAQQGGLVTLYYGGTQHEKDAQHLSEQLRGAFPEADVEYYYGGMKNAEYWISLDE